MLRTLMKIRFQGLFMKTMKGSKNKNVSVGKIIFMALMFVYLASALGIMFGGLFFSIYKPFKAIGFEWLYFAIMAIMIVLLCFIGSVFTTQQEIYGAKDNELLLSMPLKVRDILLSRVGVLLLLNYVYEALVALPAIAVFYYFAPFNLIQFIFLIITLLTLPLLGLALSCAFGWIMAMIMQRIRNKTIITMVLSLGFLGLYFYVINKFPTYLMALINDGKSIGQAIEKSLFPLYHLAKGISDIRIISIIIYLICALVPFALVMYLLSKNFITLATAKAPSKRIKVKEGDIKHNSLKMALLKREVKHFTSNPMVMMNGALGIVFTIILAGALIVKGPEIINALGILPPALQANINEYMMPLMCIAVVGTNSINVISASLISLEGNRLWIIKSLPIATKEILESKLVLHLALCLPAGLIFSLVGSIVFSLTIRDTLLVIIIPMLFTVFVAQFGLLMNLWKPKFDWINETVVVKQGFSVMITMFSMIALSFVIAGGYIWLFSDYLNIFVYVLIWLVLLTIVDAGMYYLLNTWGIKRFEAL